MTGKKITRRKFLQIGSAAVAVTAAGLVLKRFLKTDKVVQNELPTVKIGCLPITDHLILGVSYERESEGFEYLNLEPVRFKNWTRLAEELKAGNLHGAFILTPLGISITLEGVPVKVVLLGHRDGSVVIVKVGSEIKTIDDLKGKSIAIPHELSIHNILLHKIATQTGIEYGKDVITKVMAPVDMPFALSAGEIDGYIVAEPFGAQAEEYGVGKILILSRDIWKNHICCALVMREEFLNEYPEAMREMTGSFVRSGVFIEDNPRGASEIGGRFCGQAKRTILRALTVPDGRVTYRDLFPNKKDFHELQNYMVDIIKLSNRKVNIDECVETSFAQEAYDKIGARIRS